MKKSYSIGVAAILFSFSVANADEVSSGAEADLLIVGGTESGCAAALQAARMGVKSITLVNDIEWLGGQFSAEALMAIDENRGPEGYGHGVPFPRSGIFSEVMNHIEKRNREKYGVPRPGNTRVITTCLPSDAEQVFRSLLKPHLENGTITIHSNYFPVSVLHDETKTKVTGVRFQSTSNQNDEFVIRAKLTIDASDWGDVIRLSGADYEFGPDLKSRYNEPLAPTSREEYPQTDMNPITYCMVLKETDTEQVIEKPTGFDRRNYDGLPYPSDPSWIYRSRRLVDRRHFSSIKTPDAVLLCFPAFDYPLENFSQPVINALEEIETGASKKNIVEMSREQRQIVFDDAKQHSLGFLYYLQTVAHKKASDQNQTFRKLQLTDEFGTADRLPFKPYVRESLRLKSMYQLRQQDTTGYRNDALNYAAIMFHDPIACWQFEYDFHPTRRVFLDDDPSGPWHPIFREKRTWGPPYSGRSQFSLRSLVPEKMNGLLGAQKNLGYSSIVSSAVRLHDQSVAVGQGSGAVAATAILYDVEPRTLNWSEESLREIWNGLLTAGNVPQTLWPFGDLVPTHAHFVAINQLAVRKLIPLAPNEVNFYPDRVAANAWKNQFLGHASKMLKTKIYISKHSKSFTRAEFASKVWAAVENERFLTVHRASPTDADLDGIPDLDDPLPLSAEKTSWGNWSPPPPKDGKPDPQLLTQDFYQRYQFGGKESINKAFALDSGEVFDTQRGYGWKRSLAKNFRQRGIYPEVVRDSFLFTRSHDTWELKVPDGTYQVTVCIGDSGHEQFGQNVTLEGQPVLRNVRTPVGQFEEKTVEVTVTDGLLTLEIGLPDSTTNTCLNWLILRKQPTPSTN